MGSCRKPGPLPCCERREKTGLAAGLSAALAPWRKPLATHDPGKILLDLAVAVALGGDCLADIAVLREEPGVFGPVASDPTVSRLLSTLAADASAALAAINTARAGARRAAWAHAGAHAPDHDISAKDPLIIDVDATLVTAHSEKEHAAPTYKRGFGHHPLGAFVDHGQTGTGEALALQLRPGNAGSNTAADHLTVIAEALAQLPFSTAGRVGRKVLIRTDGAGGTHDVVTYLTKRALSYSLGFGLTTTMVDKLSLIPDQVWTPAYDAEETPRDGAWVAELTGLLDLSAWPAGMRVIRKERPHPGAQLRFTDTEGLRLTAFITNTRGGQLADLELRHRRRARCEDRIRISKDTGLTNLPLHGYAQNKLWLAVVCLAVELTAWLQLLAFTDHPARRWEPKRLRLRLFTIAGRLVRHARRHRLRLSAHAPWRPLIATALTRLKALPALT